MTREREAVSALQQSAEWLVGVEWTFCGNKLCANVVIRAHDHDYELRLIYPTLFPQVPPSVFPLNATERLSGHQYGGADGPLCLEWGPDNWQSEVTGAQMLVSAYNLLDIENPLGEREQEADEAAAAKVAPSRHQLKPGQELRNRFSRFYLGNETLEYLLQLAVNAHGTFRFSTRLRKKSCLAIIQDLQASGKREVWSDSSIPEFFRGEDDKELRTGVFFKTDHPTDAIQAVNSVGDLFNILQTVDYGIQISVENNNLKIEDYENESPGYLIFDRDNNPHFFLLFDNGSVWKFARVESDSSRQINRTPDNLRGLPGKSVGIVGLGSAGSKVALSLARMGIRHFYLVDYDIFLPENVERNALDWSNLGEHKVDAVQDALLRLGVDFDIEVSRTDVTGQESSASVSIILDRLGKCDFIIDATADAKVFNLLTAIASVYKKPLIWFEVYAGGIGGMIARSRPELDPAPQTIRADYLRFCEQNPAPEYMRPYATNSYGSEDEEGEIYQASDTDVAIIAHHAVRLAADTALMADNSSYPNSMYLIGLDKAWIFEAPFATIPLATAHLLERKRAAEESDTVSDGDNAEFIVSLIKKLDAANTSA